MFSGGLGVSLMAGVLYSVRALPKHIYQFLLWRFSVELEILNNDPTYQRVDEWLAAHPYAKRARRLRASTSYQHEESVSICTPGAGSHVIWRRGRPLVFYRGSVDKPIGSGFNASTERIIIRTWGTDPTPLHRLVDEVQDFRKQQGKTVDVFLYRHYWRLACRKVKRDLDSVILPSKTIDTLVGDIDKFLSSRDHYARLGVPYRMGVLLEGPPGCGKTSLVMALASHYSRPVYALNLGSIPNDDTLIEAITSVPEHGILLIEDLDATEASAARVEEPKAKIVTPGEVQPQEARTLSLSGLLNAIDGVFSRDGRILIMTTNHPEKIDEALLRPGRADLKLHIGPLEHQEVQRMCARFLGDPKVALDFSARVQPPITPSELQGKLLRHSNAQVEEETSEETIRLN